MSAAAISVAWDATELSPTYRLALFYLAENVGDERGNGYVTRKGLERFIGPHADGLADVLFAGLEDAGFVTSGNEAQVDWIGDLEGAEICFRFLEPAEAVA